MDRSYKEDIRKFKAALEQLKKNLSAHGTKTDWMQLRVEPLLEHVKRLDQILKSPRFAREAVRLREGVAMFRADLDYLRTNIKILKGIIAVAGKREKSEPGRI